MHPSSPTRAARAALRLCIAVIILTSCTSGSNESSNAPSNSATGPSSSSTTSQDLRALRETLDPMQDTEELGRSLQCETSLPLAHDVQSKVAGSGYICVLADAKIPPIYVIKQSGFPSAALDERIWATGDPTIRLVLFEDGYVIGHFEVVERLGAGDELEPAQWRSLSREVPDDMLLPAEVFECRSVLSTALSSDFRFAAGVDSNGWVESSLFDYGEGAGSRLIDAARDDLESGIPSESLEMLAERPDLIDFLAESHSASYGSQIIHACGDHGN